MNYYNEFDQKTAHWLHNLVEAGKIPNGFVDSRSITEVDPDEIKRYTQCHFFAGIAGWSYAIKLAGWPADRPVWTGSCPCQPFSSAGNQKGKADERHLWPVWFNLIRECRPPTIFGEQVSSAIAHGWLDDVYQGLESEGYACGSAVLPACSVGAPHKRDRLFFVADHDCERCNGESISIREKQGKNIEINRCGESDVAHAISQGLQGHGGFIDQPVQEGREGAQRYPWEGGVWIDCPDGKQRLIEPSIRLLAHGVSGRMAVQRTNECGETETHWYNRVAALKAFGNAIVPQVAAEFIKAYMRI